MSPSRGLKKLRPDRNPSSARKHDWDFVSRTSELLDAHHVPRDAKIVSTGVVSAKKTAPESFWSTIYNMSSNAESFTDHDLKQQICKRFAEEQRMDFMHWDKQHGAVSVSEEEGLKSKGNQALLTMTRCLQRIGFFGGYAENQLVALVRGMHIAHMGANQWVFRKGDDAQDPVTGGFYAIICGTIHVYVDESKPPVAEFSSGRSFGDTALITSLPRNASIWTVEPCTFGIIRKDVYMRYKRHSDQLDAQRLARFIKSFPQFSDWKLNTLICFTGMMSVLKVTPGTVIVSPGDRGQLFCFIKSGRFHITQRFQSEKRVGLPVSRQARIYKHSSTEEAIVIAVLTTGAAYGDLLLLESQSGKDSDEESDEDETDEKLIAVTDGEVLTMPADTFRRVAVKWGYQPQPDPRKRPDDLVRKAKEAGRWSQFRRNLFDGIFERKELDDKKTKSGGMPTLPSDKNRSARIQRYRTLSERTRAKVEAKCRTKPQFVSKDEWESQKPYPRKVTLPRPRPGGEPLWHGASTSVSSWGSTCWERAACGLHEMHPGWCEDLMESDALSPGQSCEL